MTGASGPSAVRALILLVALVSAWAGATEESWIKPRADESLLVAMAHNGDRWIAVGERGHVLTSDDARTWVQVKVPTRVLLTAVDIDARGLGFAVGHDATIIRTQDNGDTWERVYHAPDQEAPFLDVTIVDDKKIVAVGAYGLYAETDDAGRTWELRVLEPGEFEAEGGQTGEEGLFYDFHLNDIAIADDGYWYIAAEAGNVYRSDDQGVSWLKLPSPYEGSFFGVLPMAPKNVLLFGLQGRLFRSEDAGLSWTRIRTGTDATLTSGMRLPNGEALVAGHAGILLTQIGTRGDLTRARLDNRPAVSDVYLLESGELLTVGEDGIRRWPAGTAAGT